MKQETKTAAIKHARANVTLSNMGKNWRVDSYSPKHRAWWQGTPQGYWEARQTYSQKLVDYAREFMGAEYAQYDGGSWIDYV